MEKRVGISGWINLLYNNVNFVFQIFVGLNLSFNFLNAVHNGGMVLLTENFSHIDKGSICQLPAEVHDNLTGLHKF